MRSNKPFLLISSRPEDDATAGEYASFRTMMGVTDAELHHHRIDQEPLGEVDLADYSGILIGGGPFNASDSEKSDVQLRVEAELGDLARRAIEQDYPFFGACYGVGVIGLVTGAVIDDTYTEVPSCVTLTITEEGKVEPLLADVDDTFDAVVGHKEGCTVLPENAVLLVRGSACPHQMYRLGENVFVTQFHPELDLESFFQRLRIYKDYGYFAADELDSIISQSSRFDITPITSVLRNFARRYAVSTDAVGV